ncbi:hypothetical protein F5X97DRAFT_119289 [Nemania serpens]|nr:hypothetical protein F5X97DRAFT_119289 [Nemania serpens]
MLNCSPRGIRQTIIRSLPVDELSLQLSPELSPELVIPLTPSSSNLSHNSHLVWLNSPGSGSEVGDDDTLSQQEAKLQQKEAKLHQLEEKLHQQEEKLRQLKINLHQQEAQPHQQEIKLHQKGAGPHQKEAGPHQQEAEPQLKEADLHELEEALYQRGIEISRQREILYHKEGETSNQGSKFSEQEAEFKKQEDLFFRQQAELFEQLALSPQQQMERLFPQQQMELLLPQQAPSPQQKAETRKQEERFFQQQALVFRQRALSPKQQMELLFPESALSPQQEAETQKQKELLGQDDMILQGLAMLESCEDSESFNSLRTWLSSIISSSRMDPDEILTRPGAAYREALLSHQVTTNQTLELLASLTFSPDCGDSVAPSTRTAGGASQRPSARRPPDAARIETLRTQVLKFTRSSQKIATFQRSALVCRDSSSSEPGASSNVVGGEAELESEPSLSDWEWANVQE